MKRLLRDNPTVAMLLAFFVFSCIFAYCPTALKAALAAFFLLVGLFSVIAPKRRSSRFTDKGLFKAISLSAFASVVAAVLSIAAFELYADRIDRHAGESETVTVRITDTEREYPYISYYEATVNESVLLPRGTKIIFASPVSGLEYGDMISAEVTYSSLEERSTSTFDGRRYYQSKRVMIFAEAEEIDKIGEETRFSLTHFLGGLRKSFASAILAHCGKESGGLAAAILLGYRDGLSASVRRDFRRIGISHLLAISGTHFAALIGLLEFAMRRMKLKPRLRAGINIAFALFFMGLTGFTPSVIRAGIMHVLAQLSIIVSRKPNTVNAYALSGALIILVNPFAAVDIGLQLSYAATLGCIVYLTERGRIYKQLRERKERTVKLPRFIRTVSDAAALTFTVTLFTLPLSWLYFGEVSLAAIPVNLVAVPLMTVLLYLVGAYLITYPLTVLVFPLSRLIDLLGGFIISSANAVSKIGGVIVSVRYGFAPFIVIPLAVLLIMYPLVKRKRAVAVTAVSLFAVLVGVSLIIRSADTRNTYFSYIPLGKNDGIVVKTDGKVFIGDMSNASIGYMYELTAEADRYNATEIEGVMLTHYHSKHISQIGNLCEREIVRSIVLPEPKTDSERAVYNGICDTAEEYGSEVITLGTGENYSLGNVEAAVPERTYLKRSSHPTSGMEISIADDDIVVLSSSWNESEEMYAGSLSRAEYVFLGEHSPVYKTAFTLKACESLKMVSAGGSALEYMDRASLGALGEKLVDRAVVRMKW